MQPFPVQNFPVSAVADGVHQEFQLSTMMSNKEELIMITLILDNMFFCHNEGIVKDWLRGEPI